MAEPNTAEILSRADDFRVRWTSIALEYLGKNNVRPQHVSLACLAVALLSGLTVAFGHLTWGAILFVITYACGHLAREYLRESGGTPGLIEGPVTTTLMEGLVYAGLAAHLASDSSSLLAALLVVALVGHTLSTFLANEAERRGKTVRLWWTSAAITAAIIALFLFMNQVIILILTLAILKTCACVYLFLETSEGNEARHEEDSRH
ncbi:MAG: hypothetical protein OXE81_07210 [Gammaproteobacteria bacterium]|nr:hypothetical protein [Gammaproteobacteria bacterium]MCY4277607.1 hypothetical protein [Gammaproteobacteria bacterium]